MTKKQEHRSLVPQLNCGNSQMTQLLSWKALFSISGLMLVYGICYYAIQKEMPFLKVTDRFRAPPYKFRAPPYKFYHFKINCSCINWIKNSTEISCFKTMKSNRTIYVQTMGRLGNVLFQVASAYAIAKDTDSQLVVVDTKHLKALESRPFRTITTTQWNDLNVNLVHGAHQLIDFERAYDTAVASSVKLVHSLQRFIYFGRCEHEIRHKLALKSSVIKKAESTIANIIKKHKNLISKNSSMSSIDSSSFNSTDFITVGIHARRGDLTDRFWHTDGYRLPGISYFTNSMNYFKSEYSKVIFILATDDKPWAQQHLLQTGVYLSPLKSPAEDMALVSSCDNAIVSLGTFSWWAGFFNKGTVIYFKDWIAPNSNIWKRIEYIENERFPPYWLPMT